LITNDGSLDQGFPFKYDTNRACAISDPVTDTVVVTGGVGGDTMNTVVRYGQQGWLEDLPPLITGRESHACSSFMSSGRLMFLVTGGNFWITIYDPQYLDSTEIFDPLVGSWTASGAKLPRPMAALKAETINDRVLLFGGFNFNSDYDDTYDDILEYDPEEDTITSVGHMIQAKESHAISVVEAAEYTKWCDGSI